MKKCAPSSAALFPRAGLDQCILYGAGNLGKALSRNPMFEKRGVDIVGMFDVSPAVIGEKVGECTVQPLSQLEDFCRDNTVDIAVLTLPKDAVEAVADRLIALHIPGLWNFTGKELDRLPPDMLVENVHIGDSLMTLCFEMRCREQGEVK